MTNREYLKQIKLYDAEIRELKSLKKAEKDTEILNDLNILIAERTKVYRDVLKSISNIRNPIYRRILIKRYLKGESIKRIAYDMNYSCEYMYELLKKAEHHIKQS